MTGTGTKSPRTLTVAAWVARAGAVIGLLVFLVSVGAAATDGASVRHRVGPSSSAAVESPGHPGMNVLAMMAAAVVLALSIAALLIMVGRRPGERTTESTDHLGETATY